MLTIRAMSNGRGYATHHLVHSDYFAEGQRVVGHWQGRGAAELGLLGEVTERQFEAIRESIHPATGGRLRPRQSADRLSEDGEIQSRGATFVRLHPVGAQVGLGRGHTRRG
jgi:hypothetical protein